MPSFPIGVRIASVVAIFSIIFFFCYNLVGNPSLVFGDQFGVLVEPANGYFIKPFIVPHLGRFPPFAMQDFNALLLFKNLETMLSAIDMILVTKFVLFVSMTYFALRVCLDTPTAVIGCLVFCSLSISQIFIFYQPQYAESSILVILASVLYFYMKAQKNPKYIYFIVIALLSAIASYLKEPVSGLFLVMGLINITLRRRWIHTYEIRLSFFWIANFILFFLLYYVFIYAEITQSYASGRRVTLSESLLSLVNTIQWVPLIFICLRIAQAALNRNSKIYFADVIMIAGFAYGLVYVVLGFNLAYYFLPARFLMMTATALYLSHMLPPILESMHLFRKYKNIIFYILLTVLCLHSQNIGGKASEKLSTMKAGTSYMLNFLENCERNGFSIYYWLPEYESDKDKYTWQRGEFFAGLISYYYYLHTGKKIDIAKYRKFSHEGLLRDYPEDMEPFRITRDFQKFANSKSILILMPESPSEYDNKPWEDKADFSIIPMWFSVLVKKVDLPVLGQFIHVPI